MSEILPIVFAVVLVIITVVLAVVGIQLIMVLVEFKRTLRKIKGKVENLAESQLKYKQLAGRLGKTLRCGHCLPTLRTDFHGFFTFFRANP